MSRACVSTYWLSIVGLKMCLSCTVTDIFSVEYRRDLEICVRGRSTSLKMAPIDRPCTRSYSHSVVTMALSGIISEIKRDISRKSRFFIPRLHSPFPLKCDVDDSRIFGIKVARCLSYKVVQKIAAKFSPLSREREHHKRQTYDRRTADDIRLK